MASKNGIDFSTNQIFKWQFNLKDKSFVFDPLLLTFLSFPKSKKLSLAHLFNCFDKGQSEAFNAAFKNVLISKEYFEKTTLINAGEYRYLVNFCINISEKSNSIVEGSVQYLKEFPNLDIENSFYRKIFTHSETARMIASSDHTIVTVNKVFCDELGYEEKELVGHHARILKSGSYEPEFYKKLWDTVDTNKVWRGELLAINKDKETYAREVKIERFELDDGDHFYFSTSIKLDIASSVLDEQITGEVKYSAIPDKAQYTQSLLKSYEEMSTENTIVVATFSISWLQKISELTANWLTFQRFQLTKFKGILGAVSKGIYSIYWVDEKDPDKIDAQLRKLLKAFSYGYDDSGYDLFSKVSIGASILGVDAKRPAQLISHSTQTLIANPTGESSSLYYFDRRLATRFDRHHVLATLLRKALNEKNVDVFYQPIVEIPSLKIVEFEALFRVKLETDIDYDTQELINIAETHNWIDEVDEVVTKIALGDLPKIQKHYKCDDIAMAINRSLANDRVNHCCLEDTINILLASKTNLKNVTIELTESAIFENFEQQKQWVDELRKHGAKVAIDDFGTGYSSFAYLSNLPVNFIKIDRSFVTGLTLDSNEYAMIEMLCKLAHKIGAKVIAEGVEEVEEMTLLSRANVDLLQGYIFSKALSLDSILGTPAEPYPQAFVEILQQDHNPTLRDLYDNTVKVVNPDDRLLLIKKELDEKEQYFFIIVDNKKCVGVLSTDAYHAAVSPYIGTKGEQKRDLLTLDRRVHQVMDKEFHSLHIDCDIKSAEQFFAEKPYSLIVVTNNNDHYLGVVTIQELLNYHQLINAEEVEHNA